MFHFLLVGRILLSDVGDCDEMDIFEKSVPAADRLSICPKGFGLAGEDTAIALDNPLFVCCWSNENAPVSWVWD